MTVWLGTTRWLLVGSGIAACACGRMGFDLPVVDQVASDWVTVASGSFTMGATAAEPCHGQDAGTNEPAHSVSLTHAFEIFKTEVTAEDFLRLLGHDPSQFADCGSMCPVDGVSWYDAATYCNALSAEHGLDVCYECTGSGAAATCVPQSAYVDANVYDCPGYRLPTDAEWEYAYRAGTTAGYYNGAAGPVACNDCATLDSNADAIGWYCANSGGAPHPVGQKQSNAWGLFDMAGNVWEWVNDWHLMNLGVVDVTDPWGVSASSRKVVRGGSWRDEPLYLRAAKRDSNSPAATRDENGGSVGFRCVRTLP
jgi:formylglycine-generating enzyme required for sulfatase activity